MDNFTATEVAYKNGYNQALMDFADNITNIAELFRINDFEHKWAISEDELCQLVKKLEKK